MATDTADEDESADEPLLIRRSNGYVPPPSTIIDARRARFVCAALSLLALVLLAFQSPSSRIPPSATSLVCGPPSTSSILPPSHTSLSSSTEPLNHCRLLSSLSRMRSGSPLRLAAVGGSITRAGPPIRSWLEIATNRLNAAHPPHPSDTLTTDTLSSPSSSLRSSAHVQQWGGPADRHLSRNLAMGGIPSSFVSTCLSSFFPNHSLSSTDLLLVEFAVNDLSYAGNLTAAQSQGEYFQAVAQGEMTTGGQMGEFDPATNLERIVRYALAQTLGGEEGGAKVVDGPAVVLVEFCDMDGSNAAAYHTAVAQRYGVPLISVCELLPFSYPVDDEAGIAPRQGGMMRDHTHPTLPGHAVASAMLTDRLLNQLLPQVDDPAVAERCSAWQAQVGEVATAALLPHALFPINAAPAEYRCTLGQFTPGVQHDHLDSLHFLAFDVRSSSGWEYRDETGKGKFGWSSTTVNSTLTLALQPTTRSLVLSYLRSYANTGSARCFLTAQPGGWTSPSITIDAWWPRRFSTFELQRLPADMWRSMPREVTELELNLQLVDVEGQGQGGGTAAEGKPANRFKLVGVFELAHRD